MKVGFVVGTLGRGGAEKQLVFMLRALRSAGIETPVFCLTSGESHEAAIRSLGVQVEYVGETRNRLLRLGSIAKRLRAHRCDIVQSSHFYTNIYAAAAGRLLSVPSIGAIRSNLISELSLHGVMGRFQVTLPHFLISNTAFARDHAIRNGVSPARIEYVRNAVEVPDRRAPSIGFRRSQFTFIFVGRLSKEKRPERFVRMAARLVARHPGSLRFRIVGDGPLRREMEQLSKTLNLDGHLAFLGELADMDEIYGTADALVSTSDYEGSSNVVLEAMAHALPVVATNVGGTPELLNGHRGLLVDPGDDLALIEAAEAVFTKPELRARIAEAGYSFVCANHSLKRLQGHLAEIYGRLSARMRKSLDAVNAPTRHESAVHTNYV